METKNEPLIPQVTGPKVHEEWVPISGGIVVPRNSVYRRIEEVESADHFLIATEYRLIETGELVHRSVHVNVKRALVAEGVANYQNPI